MITTNPKLAWALATDSSVKIAPGPWDEELAGGGYGQMTSLERKAEYAPVYSRICRLEEEQPGVAAVGHVLFHADTEARNHHLDYAADMIFNVVRELTPAWGDKRVWRDAKKERVPYLIKVALMERSENLSGERTAWGPERIKAIMHSWYGMSIETRFWSRDWMPTWMTIQSSIDWYENDALEPINEVIGQIAYRVRRAA